MADSLRLIVIGLTLAALTACTPSRPTSTLDGYPQDFQLAALVEQSNPKAPEAFRSAVYLVKPDLTLHAAVGPGARLDLYPRPTAALSPEEMRQLYVIASAVVDTAELVVVSAEEPALPTATLSLEFIAAGRDERLSVPVVDLPDDRGETTAAARLVRELAELRGSLPATLSPATQPEPETPATTHTVKPGDTLAAIARTYYGDASQWRRIYEANRNLLPSPAMLQVGMRLVIPDSSVTPR